MAILSDLKAKNIKPGDRPVADGTITGLRLEPGKAEGHGKWTLCFVSPLTNNRRDMGLGSYPDVGINEARRAAVAARELIRNGQAPIEHRKADKATRLADGEAVTFEQAARSIHEDLKDGGRTRNTPRSG